MFIGLFRVMAEEQGLLFMCSACFVSLTERLKTLANWTFAKRVVGNTTGHPLKKEGSYYTAR